METRPILNRDCACCGRPSIDDGWIDAEGTILCESCIVSLGAGPLASTGHEIRSSVDSARLGNGQRVRRWSARPSSEYYDRQVPIGKEPTP